MNLNRRQFSGLVAASVFIGLSTPGLTAQTLTVFKPTGGNTFDHLAYDSILRQNVNLDAQGYASVNYNALVGQRGAVDAYVASLTASDPTQLSRDEAHAFWINLYNAKTLSVMLEHWPVNSIRDIKLGGGGLFGKGPWSKKLMTINGTELSLDDVEHKIVRAIFKNPLSHYALNCASYSCPNLMPKAYTAANLNALMQESATLYINHPRAMTIENGEITASKIFSWYADDFGGKSKLKAHWSKFATPELAEQINAASIADYEYDWTPNVAR